MTQANNAISNGNATPFTGFQTFAPLTTALLQGQTDNAAPTLATNVYRYMVLNGILFFNYLLVSSTMTKTTTTDQVRVALPLVAGGVAGQVWTGHSRVENGTAVANMIVGEITTAQAYIIFRNYTLAATSGTMTWATTTPGIGVLTNTITFNGTGWYEI